MSAVETSPSASTNLRDFLLLKEDDVCSAIRRGRGRGRLSTDNSTVSEAPTMENRASRTLLDMFRCEEGNRSSPSSGSGSGGNLYRGGDSKSRRLFEEMIRKQAVCIGTTSAGPSRLNVRGEFTSQESSLDILTESERDVRGRENDRGGVERIPAVARRSSTPFGVLVPILIESDHRPDGAARGNLVGGSQLALSPTRSSRDVLAPRAEETARQPVRCLWEALAEERDLSAREVLDGEEARGGHSPRMLLMDLLEETDTQVGFELSKYALQEEDRNEESSMAGGANNCCVCMVRRKGAAFIPCGHTFCRMCSRELWASRGTCPICIASILEILDIF